MMWALFIVIVCVRIIAKKNVLDAVIVVDVIFSMRLKLAPP